MAPVTFAVRCQSIDELLHQSPLAHPDFSTFSCLRVKMDSSDLTTPALEPPQGHFSDLNKPPVLRVHFIATAAVTLVLSTIAVVLRIFMKARVLRRVQLEEYILVLSLAGFYAFTLLMVTATSFGEGSHQWNVSIADFKMVVERANVIEIIYCPTILGAKVAMLLQMKRMFVVSKKGKLYWLHEILLWTNVPCYLAITLSFILACVPRQKLWESDLPGRCISSNGSLIASSAINVVSDITMLLFPLMVVMRLQLPTRTKLILGMVFGTGILGCISSVFRLVYGVFLTKTSDFTWSISPVGLWAIGEVCSVILSGAVPMLPGFVKFVRGQEGSGSGPSYGLATTSRRRDNTGNLALQGQTVPGQIDKGAYDRYYELGVMNDAHASVTSLIEGRQKADPGSSIVKTVHIQTGYE
ncbi:uncharacterized protein APUU_30024A [Aspergillus puulaauensis]|uniref:Rhodopsin domain-containing protein n=1 Tax=Aspergillus puulaauensis TaxID=1220207 RepID=A0A7R7XIC1_9EURO|nr:uncharacterized protein APUU_30024A [Aspergillus puulaauensis]BCS21799.1 hypothetical protein APUU_30024A [Aspergillus puulaauensis]